MLPIVYFLVGMRVHVCTCIRISTTMRTHAYACARMFNPATHICLFFDFHSILPTLYPFLGFVRYFMHD